MIEINKQHSKDLFKIFSKHKSTQETRNKIFRKKYYSRFFFYILLFTLVSQIFSNDNIKIKRKLLFNSCKISLIIEGAECNHILNLNGNNEPDQIIINNIKKFNINCTNNNNAEQYKINLGNENLKYQVELIWDNFFFNTLENLFSGISNIIKVDFSEFDSSKVTNMKNLFQNCISLKLINFSNKFITSNVIDMSGAFSGCTSLKYLDLSKLDTTNTQYMQSMFQDCNSLTLLNIPNFIESKVENINNIFQGCSKLEYLNIYNSNFSSINNINRIFNSLSATTICINSDATNIIQEINRNRFLKLNCSKNFEEFFEEKNYIIELSEINYECDTEEFFRGICTVIFFNDEERIQFIEKIIKEIKNKKIMDLLNEVTNDNKILLGYEGKNLYQLCTIDNQITLENSNNTIIDFGECEQELKSVYPNKKLILFKIERFYEGYKIPIINYKVFIEDSLDELDINVCKEKPQHLTPVLIKEDELYKYDLDNDYYNNLCSIYSSESNIDINFYERKIIYNEKHLSLCEYDCIFIGYNSNNSKVKCRCPQKEIRSQKLNTIIAEKNLFNFSIIKCFNLLSSLDNIYANPGFYIFSLNFILLIIAYVIFFIKEYKKIKQKFKEIIFYKINSKENNLDEINKDKNDKMVFGKDAKLKYKKFNKMLNIKSLSNESGKLNTLDSNKNIFNIKSLKTLNFSKKINSIKNDINFNNFELFHLPFNLALIYDKRSLLKIYCSLVKMNQLIIFSLLNNKDDNIGIIKKYILFFSFSLHYAINILFFNDTVMHQIYIDEGIYNIFYQYKFILYSSIISYVIIKIMINAFIKNEKYFISIKLTKKLNKVKKERKNALKNILIKNIIFLCINFLLIIFFGYYSICFNALYKNTKIYIIINTCVSFSISLICPFVIDIVPSLLRRKSIYFSKNKKAKKKIKEHNKNLFPNNLPDYYDREYSYNISQVMQCF